MIGRKIYYDKTSGEVIQDTGEHSGEIIETTVEQDFESYLSLSERVPSTVGCLQLEYGEYAQDFMECNGYMVDVSGEIPSLLFSYPDASEPEAPPVYRASLSVEVDALKTQNADIIFALVMNDLM